MHSVLFLIFWESSCKVGSCIVRVTLQSIRCYATTEPDGDEIYCLLAPSGADRQKATRIEIGNFSVKADSRPEKLLWNASSGATITFMENDENEPARGSDDFIGEIVVAADGSCTPGHNTLDEGFGENNRSRPFSLQGSAAHQAVQWQMR